MLGSDLRFKAALSFAFAVIASPRNARAQAPATVNVSVDATAGGTPLERVWPYHGYDEVNYTTTAPGQALLKSLGTAHTAPVGVRTHFLLNTGTGAASLKWGSTNVYTEDAAGNPIYNWTLMDGIMDSITGAGVFPFTEIAFMPQAMTTAPATTPYQNTGVYTLDGGCFYPPKDYTKWGALIRAWATHVNTRYPAVESSWKWELWNEPDIGYWHGTPAEYDKLYDYTEAAVHAVLPNAPIGGPAVAVPAGTFLPQFLQHCATGINAVTGQAGARLDLISFHAKGGVAITAGHVEMNLGNQLRLHRTGFTSVAAVAPFRQTPIYITEADPDGCAACPASTTPADVYRNSPAYGAYEVAMMKRTLELGTQMGVKVGGLVTWAFTFPNTPYFAGYRALTTNGITMPVLGAFKLLGSLAGTRIPVTSTGALTLAAILSAGVRAQADVDAMATLNGQQLQVLVWNYHDDLVAVPASPVHLSVKIPPSFGSRAMVTHLRVDDTHGDAYTVWVSQGSPASPSAAQITAMQQAMEPVAISPPQTVDVVAGMVALDFDLPRFGISLVTLGPAAEAADGSTDAPVGSDSARDVGVDNRPGDTGGDRNNNDLTTSDLGINDAAGATDTPIGTGDAAQDPHGSSPDGASPAKTDGGGCACDVTVAAKGSPSDGNGSYLLSLFVVMGMLLGLRRPRRGSASLISRR